MWNKCYTCSSSSPFVKVSKKCHKSVTRDLEIFPGGNGSAGLAVKLRVIQPTSQTAVNIRVQSVQRLQTTPLYIDV